MLELSVFQSQEIEEKAPRLHLACREQGKSTGEATAIPSGLPTGEGFGEYANRFGVDIWNSRPLLLGRYCADCYCIYVGRH
jgi:hypothetical protein